MCVLTSTTIHDTCMDRIKSSNSRKKRHGKKTGTHINRKIFSFLLLIALLSFFPLLSHFILFRKSELDICVCLDAHMEWFGYSLTSSSSISFWFFPFTFFSKQTDLYTKRYHVYAFVLRGKEKKRVKRTSAIARAREREIEQKQQHIKRTIIYLN